MNKAIIGGTGVYNLLGSSKVKKVKTKYGTVEIDIVNIDSQNIAFLTRHGKQHSNPPHKVNYRANMAALHSLGIEYIYSIAAVGSCRRDFEVADVVIIKDFIDFTNSRDVTFFDDGTKVAHVIMNDPYCSYLREEFVKNAKNLPIKGEAIYVCTQGPRFETASEIKMFSILGGDVVGMTSVPEVVLAKELGMCYCTIGVITNMCTGLSDEIEGHEIDKSMNKSKKKIMEIFLKIFKKDLTKQFCGCKESLIIL